MGSSPEQAPKLHAVCLPFPAQGHINPMLKLAMALHHKGFYITFVNTESIHNRLLKSRGPNSLNPSPDFQFETIPDGILDNDSTRNGSEIVLFLVQSILKNSVVPFKNLLSKISSAESIPNVTCVISDAIMSFGVVAAQEIGVPGVSLRTTNALLSLINKYLPLIVAKGLLPLKDEADLTNGYLETNLDCIASLKGLRLKDFPDYIRTTDINDPLFNFIKGETEGSSHASAIIFNTFDALETDALNELSPLCPPIYTIGPIHSQANKCPQNTRGLIKGNLWKEDPKCLQWLNSKEDKSVVYVNFGSISVLTPQELAKFAWGLANCKKCFLWIIRDGSVVGDSTSSVSPVSFVLPGDFLEETKDRRMISTWCPQEEVIKHPSIGVFLTHCGWNSMMESLAAGVPMICWPFFADQYLNCRSACKRWDVGVEIDKNVGREEVEKVVREVMDEEEGKKLRNRACQWKGKIEEAIGENGSSVLNMDKLVHEILLGPWQEQ